MWRKLIMKKLIILVIIVFLSLTSYASAKLEWAEVSDDVVPNGSVTKYVNWHVKTSYLGHSDWRLPTRIEILERKGKTPNAQIWVADSCFRDINPDNPGGNKPLLCLRGFNSGDAPEVTNDQRDFKIILIREY
jgi:hypothetical protein